MPVRAKTAPVESLLIAAPCGTLEDPKAKGWYQQSEKKKDEATL